MTAARSFGPRRSGITLTEILIAILIMGVGLISLATLFPLGLLRLQRGTQLARSGLTYLGAASDINIRALLIKQTFRNTWYGDRDPFVQDTYADGSYFNVVAGQRVGSGAIAAESLLLPQNNVGLTSGLPVCYDPLWRSITGVLPSNPPNSTATTMLYDPNLIAPPGLVTAAGAAYRPNEARFGSGIFGGATPYIAPDTGGLASAHGLQRLTNFIPFTSGRLTPEYAFTSYNLALDANLQPADGAGNVFTSVDDIVFNPAAAGANAPTPLLPDMSAGGPQADYRFTWFFTGRQIDANGNGAQFIGDVVVCDSRPFGFDPVPGITNAFAPAGETVVEAIFGVGLEASVVRTSYNNTIGFAVNDRSVLLRWRNTLADPQVRVGGWIADVTYERDVFTYKTRVGDSGTTFARCNWYQIAKRVDPQADPNDANFRTMTVTLTAPVRTKTLLVRATGLPVHRNVALIMPSVVNVFPRSFEVH